MCGIAAVIHANTDLATGLVSRMLPVLRHRGPDAQGLEAPPGAVLGHVRLSILDLTGGRQPMTHEGRWWLVFNGEIFNHLELRRLLPHWRFQTSSDTETLLAGFVTWGADVVHRLRGQFAFLVWDALERRFFAARDHLGEKPLYWANLGEGLAFASEVKGLRAAGLGGAMNADTLQEFLLFGYVPPERCVWHGIHALAPGSWMRGSEGEVQEVRRFWWPQLSVSAPKSPTLGAEQMVALLRQAVTRQRVADVRVGALLSGGLDSTSVVGLMGEEVETFAVGFGKVINELPYARAAAEAFKTHHHEVVMDELEVGAELERLVGVYDEPFADSSAVPMRVISEFARQRVKVVLSGDGGDEVFGGYSWYRWFLLRERWTMRALGGRWTLGLMKRLLPAQADELAGVREYSALGRRHGHHVVEHVAATSLAMTLHDEAFRVRHADLRWSDVEADLRRKYEASLDGVSAFDLTHYLPGDVLTKVDRATMAVSLESRAPLLDLDLVDATLAVPASQRMAWPRTKPLLRAAVENQWPPVIRNRAKQGFGAPMREWLGRPDVRSLMAEVNANGSALRELLPGLPSDVFEQAGLRRPRLGWTLLTLGLWMRANS